MNVVSSTARLVGTGCIVSYKSNYHTITTTTVPIRYGDRGDPSYIYTQINK